MPAPVTTERGNQTYSQVMSRLDSLTGVVERLSKNFKEIGSKPTNSAGGDGASLITKGMPFQRGMARTNVVNGQRNSGFMDVYDVIDPNRQKSLGRDFGEFLLEVAQLSDPARHHLKNSEDIARVAKSLENRKAIPINKTALAEGSGATGGYTVPPQFGNELLALAAEESFLRKQCRTVAMASRTFFYPVLDQVQTPVAGQSSYFGGIYWQWQPEANNYQTNAETEPKFRQVELVARDLVGIVIASNQLLQDSALALDTVLTTLFTESMAWAYDYFILQGNGANQPQGMLNAPARYTVTKSGSAGTFLLADAAEMLARMVPSSYKTCIWMVHPSVLKQLITMTNGATNSPFLVWLNPWNPSGDGGPAANTIPAMLFGRPLFVTEKLPALGTSSTNTGCVMLVDPSKYLLGDRMAIQIEASPYPNFVTNQMTWRIIARWDGQPQLSKPITLADGSYQVSPIVAYNPA